MKGLLVRLSHFLARVKIWGTLGVEIWFSEKCAFGGFNSTSISPRSLNRT